MGSNRGSVLISVSMTLGLTALAAAGGGFLARVITGLTYSQYAKALIVLAVFAIAHHFAEWALHHLDPRRSTWNVFILAAVVVLALVLSKRIADRFGMTDDEYFREAILAVDAMVFFFATAHMIASIRRDLAATQWSAIGRRRLRAFLVHVARKVRHQSNVAPPSPPTSNPDPDQKKAA